jgi:D-aspartate ligase
LRIANSAIVLGMFETGLGVGRSLGRNGIKVIGMDFKKDIAFHSKYISAFICPHPIDRENDFLDYLVAYGKAQTEKPVLFITSDDFLFSVSKNRDVLEECFLMNLPERQVIEAIMDKFRQYELARKVGIPTPKSFLLENLREVNEIKGELDYPIFIKACEVNLWRRNISRSIKGFIVHNDREFTERFRMIFAKGLKAIAQEVVQGPDTKHFKICCYISKAGEFLLSFALQKIRQQPIRFGVGSVVKSVNYPILLGIGKQLFTKLNYRGVGSAEFKLDARDGILKLIELNPRYWQQNILADKCGMNFPLMDYLETTGQRPVAIVDFREGVKWVNIYMDFNSFLGYRKHKEITIYEWLDSLKGPKVFSDFAGDDIQPGLHEISLCRKPFRIPWRILKKLAHGKQS